MNIFIVDLFTNFFDQSFADRWSGNCSGWTKELVIAHVSADLLIWLAYMVIPVLLIRLLKARKDIPFNIFFLLFAVFIVGCGLTHLMGAITAFSPYYYMDFWVKFITAIASLSTAWLFLRAYPHIINLPNPFKALTLIEKANKELAAANRELETFAFVAAHDLQDPVKQNYVLIRLIQDGKHHELIPEIANNNLRIQALIKNLLLFARSGANIKPEVTDLKKVLEDVKHDLQILIKETHAKIIIKNLPTINCDSVQIGRVFMNLIKNALKYTNKQPVVTVESETTKDYWIFHIQDNGDGIDEKTKENLFKIYRSQKKDGVGFGLAICKRIVESHGGTINVTSNTNGSRFTFTIKK